MPGSGDLDDLLAFVGDGRWWDRADCFTHPQARMFALNLDDVIVELRDLYPADICIELVRQGHGACVIGLFLGAGWTDRVDALLQLGNDLSLCLGWRADSSLVARLRHLDYYEAARFEVGIWAGLHRVGLVPEREPPSKGTAKRADFRVQDGARRVAIELKSLADPQRSSNIDLLRTYLSRLVTPLWSDAVGSIELNPSAELEKLLRGRSEVFRKEIDGTIYAKISACLRQGILVGRYQIEGVGVISVGPRDPTWEPSIAGQLYLDGHDGWTIENAARRVLMCVVDARDQLAATDADFRAAVVWGGWDHSPCDLVAAEVARQIGAGFSIEGVDYIGIVNSHRRRPQPGWTTEAVVIPVHDRCPLPEVMTWPRALSAWSFLHRAT